MLVGIYKLQILKPDCLSGVAFMCMINVIKICLPVWNEI